MPLISIQLNSNRPKHIVEFFDNIEATADRPEDIEVLLHIDTGDTAMEEVVAGEKPKRKFDLRILQTDLVKGYTTLWKPLNQLLQMTHPDVYFISNLFDEIRFKTKGWDSIILKYRGYYPDDIFRLRCSCFRFHNYTDFWQCGFAPDSSAFYTKKWLELSGDWNPCMGPDSFQQCVAFYMSTYDPFRPRNLYRDIAVPDIAFSGEGAGDGLCGEAYEKRVRENTRIWFILMSYKIQEEAYRRAMRINSHIISSQHGGAVENDIIEYSNKKLYVIRNRMYGHIVEALPYHLSWTRITFTNIWRAARFHYYCGGGKSAIYRSKFKGIRMLIITYSSTGTKLLKLIDKVHFDLRGRVKKLLGIAYRSEALRKYLWFMRQPYRKLLRSLGR